MNEMSENVQNLFTPLGMNFFFCIKEQIYIYIHIAKIFDFFQSEYRNYFILFFYTFHTLVQAITLCCRGNYSIQLHTAKTHSHN